MVFDFIAVTLTAVVTSIVVLQWCGGSASSRIMVAIAGGGERGRGKRNGPR